MGNIIVLALYDRISVFHTLKPLLFSRHRKLFDFAASPKHCLKRDRNKALILERFFLKPDRVDLQLLRRLRDKYEKLLFFNGNAGGGIPRLEVLPYVDYFFNKALFRDRSLYMKPLYGGELYSDYYHRNYGVQDPDHRELAVVSDERELGKLKLSWNVGVGDYPRQKLRQRFGVAAARTLGVRWARPFFRGALPSSQLDGRSRSIDIHARIALTARPSVSYQRGLILEAIRGDGAFLTGPAPQGRFNEELRRARIALSSFGWGEVCLRDFEAVLSGAMLLKPDMSHLETWPDVFAPFETYVPLAWDAGDLLEKGRYYLDHERERERIAAGSYERYQQQIQQVEEKLEAVLALIA